MNRADRLIALVLACTAPLAARQITPSPWWKNQIDPPGRIRSVTLKNIRWAVEAPIIIKGQDTDHTVEGVLFQDCTIAGRPLRSTQDARFQINSHKNIRVE